MSPCPLHKCPSLSSCGLRQGAHSPSQKCLLDSVIQLKTEGFGSRIDRQPSAKGGKCRLRDQVRTEYSVFPEAPEAAWEAGEIKVLQHECPTFAKHCGRAVGVRHVAVDSRLPATLAGTGRCSGGEGWFLQVCRAISAVSMQPVSGLCVLLAGLQTQVMSRLCLETCP